MHNVSKLLIYMKLNTELVVSDVIKTHVGA